MTGIYPGGRICVSGKSPMSNGTVGSTASTEFAHELKCAGYDGVIVSGKADEPVYIQVTNEGGEIKPAKHLWGMDGEKTLIALNREIGRRLREEEAERRPLAGARLHLHWPRWGEPRPQRRGDDEALPRLRLRRLRLRDGLARTSRPSSPRDGA